MPRLLRAIRFDASDSHVFPRAAGENEWAIPGSFMFASGRFGDPSDLGGKERQAFVSGFLALGSFGFSTVVSVAEATEEDVAVCERILADHLVEHYGAPDSNSALNAAREEISFGRELAEGVPLNTLLALQREISDEGQIEERFHIVSPPGDKPHTRVWDVVEEP
ncbi:DUF6505 family protein [Roseibium algae]|uniref:DUF6505 family protein n=1 Tax=Roseibium algae TaxID=3123038 RepID=A0ABU8TJM8_9HYPH